MELESGKISVLVNVPKNFKYINQIIDDKKFKDKISVRDYLNGFPKMMKALKLVWLDESILDTSLGDLSCLERIKVRFMFSLLSDSDVLVIKSFFTKLVYKERQYFMRFFRNLVVKKRIKILLIESDMDFIVEYFKEVIVYRDNSYQVIRNFYDDRLYEYVKMPKTVSLIKSLAKSGHVIDHEVTFNETLKAIYRGVL